VKCPPSCGGPIESFKESRRRRVKSGVTDSSCGGAVGWKRNQVRAPEWSVNEQQAGHAAVEKENGKLPSDVGILNLETHTSLNERKQTGD